ncbi:PqqD family protein [Sphingomonas alpina]|uniref:PqqD family protein n=1 Tax=Sphingomonas alpina TaxID=653931 RepID=A0A7H0LK10_9SPHN|nr:PqqD family protein [Sphingomonas alpina]QNQ10013.1 PqqD family protein [Sphingomonas alpina]
MIIATQIEDTAVISRKPTLIAADVADEAILLDVDSGYFFQLNKTAARIWNLVEEPSTLSDLYVQLEKVFAVDAATCRREAAEFVVQMRDRGLLVIDESA